ncbi:MAG: alkaline phosphatase D family protein [Burkholderiales bacterium]|nr:alkaline phosphatase D family protein [Burkholderiales bacterium]
MSTSPSRRKFLSTVAAGTAAIAAGAGLSGCSDDVQPSNSVKFLHGVASGDPLANAVILWTRVTPEKAEAVDLFWQVATDQAFTSVIREGQVSATPERDFTAKVDATGLSAGTVYFYRFRYAQTLSPVGRTKTLPAAGVAQIKLAVFSCSNYPAGFFNVYGDAARQTDIDAAIHLGDYIYEYNSTGYASAGAAALGRVSDPVNEILSSADYRKRHAQYRTDPDLQALHAAMPMICVWDDHEIANDAWRDGAENHTPATEGAWAARKAAALQAYHDWMPIRTPDASNLERIYRSFNFGDLASLHMLDTRIIGRDLQVEIESFVTAGGGFDAAGFAAAVGNPARQLLGSTQTAWLQGQMTTSTALWQILGQQVLMGRMNIPAPIALQQISVGDYAALAAIAQTAPQNLTPTQLAILQAPAIPYNLDAWDGYQAARETVLGTARAAGKNLVVLAGDTHNAWANDLLDLQGNQVGVEFATPSVSSPGFETIFPNENPAVFAAGIEQLIGPLQYTDTSRRGYMVVTANRTEVRADWRFVSTVSSRTYTTTVGKSLKALPGTGNRRIVAV